jgi:pimeloyl-ACP methyl ester carboxylesterase
MEIEHGRVKSGAVEWYYRSAGRCEVVLLVHGLSGSDHWWSKILPALAPRHRVYALDLPGFGRSRGEQDRLVPLSLGAELAYRLHQARLEIIPGAAHNPMLERPAEFNRLLLGFLQN